MEAERDVDPKPMSSQVKTSQLSSGLSATGAWRASTRLVGGGRSQDVGGALALQDPGPRTGLSSQLASLCVAEIHCKIQFPAFIAHFQQHLLSRRHQHRLWENNFYCISLAIRKMSGEEKSAVVGGLHGGLPKR